MGSPRRFVVTGSGRSGTMYMAHVLRRCGISCGHEDAFKPSSAVLDFAGYDGDASWHAAPCLSSLPNDVVVLHQIRDPMEVIRSWVTKGSFARFAVEGSVPKHVVKRLLRLPAYDGPYAVRVAVNRHAPEVFTEKRVVDRAARYWVAWNRMVEERAVGKPYLRYSVDDISPELLGKVLDLIGSRNHDRIDEALAAVPSNVNTRPRPKSGRLELDDLSPGLRAEVVDLAARYGFPAYEGTPAL